MRSFDVQDFVKRPSFRFLQNAIENLPLQETMDIAPDLIDLLDKAVAKQDASIFQDLLKSKDLIGERELLAKIWSAPYERFLERLANYPINNDDWDAISITIGGLEAWLKENKTQLRSMTRVRDQRTRRKFKSEEMGQFDSATYSKTGNVKKNEKQLLETAIHAKKRILFQLRLFAERHFKYLRGDKRQEFKEIVTISESILNQKELLEWRDYLRAMIYAEYTVPLTLSDWKDIYEKGPQSQWFAVIFGPEKIKDQDIILSVKEWAYYRLQNPEPTDKRKANKLLMLEKKISQLVEFIEQQAKYERGGDIGLFDAERDELKRILGDKDAWRSAVFRHVQTCIACGVNDAHLACAGCNAAAYCGLSCQTKDWSKHYQQCSKKIKKSL